MTKPLRAHVFDRVADDWYVEPVWVSDALFAAEPFEGIIWDPACGQGNVLEAAVGRGLRVVGSDIVQRGKVSTKLWDVRDFFQSRGAFGLNIVTNPPFGRAILAEKFIRHALSLEPQKLAVFVDVRFLFGKARAGRLFAEFPPARIWLITPRPSCPPGDYLAAGNKASGGTADYCWVVWAAMPDSVAHTELGWLRGAP